jgi:hypothetical protein
MSTWKVDWKRTPIGVRAVMVVFSVLVVVVSVGAAVYNYSIHDYANAAGFPIPIVWLGARLVIWPWRLAWAAARRSGNFSVWFVGTFLGGFIIPGLVYLLGRGKKPVLETSGGEGHLSVS